MGIFSIEQSDDTRKIQRNIRNAEIIEYGYITEAYDDGYVRVHLAVQEIEMNYPLLQFSVRGLSVNAVPEKGDKVVVLFPRMFGKEMFDSDGIVNGSLGYDIFSGMAVLLSVFRKNRSQDSITINPDGSLDAKIGGATLKLADRTLNYTNGNGTLDMANDGTVTINSHLEIKP